MKKDIISCLITPEFRYALIFFFLFILKSRFCSYPNIVWHSGGKSSARSGYLDVSTIAEFIEVSLENLLSFIIWEKFR